MTVIGEGAYGCVHKPSLECSDKPDMSYDGMISKVMNKTAANIEMKEYDVIDKIDKDKRYYLGKPEICSPKHDDITINEVDKCTWVKSKDLANMKLLIMKDGGLNVSDYIKSNDVKSTEQIERFFIEVHRVILGLNVLNANGVVHHDIKPQNIVYNEKENRINFIDFGHMVMYDTLVDRSKHSTNTHAVLHWSFPLEMIFINKRSYMDYAVRTQDERKGAFPQLWNHIKSHLTVLLSYINYKISDEIALERYNYIKQQYYDFIIFDITTSNYNEFLTKSINTIDVYGMGLTLLHVLGVFKPSLDVRTFNLLYDLGMSAINPRVQLRCDVGLLLKTYESILDDSGLLVKYGLHIVNHDILPIQEPVLEPDNVFTSCSKSGRERNIKTGRCVKKCNNGYKRDANFNCSLIRICPINKEINPFTKRCVATCKNNYIRNANFKCTRKSTVSQKTL